MTPLVSMVSYEFLYFPLNSDVWSLHSAFILKLDNFIDTSGDRQNRAFHYFLLKLFSRFTTTLERNIVHCVNNV